MFILTINAEKVMPIHISQSGNLDKQWQLRPEAEKRTIKRTNVHVFSSPDELSSVQVWASEREARSVHVRAQNELNDERRSFELVRVQHWSGYYHYYYQLLNLNNYSTDLVWDIIINSLLLIMISYSTDLVWRIIIINY